MIIIRIVSTLALYSYSFKRNILPSLFWIVFIVFDLVISFLTFYSANFNLFENAQIGLLFTLLDLPVLWATLHLIFKPKTKFKILKDQTDSPSMPFIKRNFTPFVIKEIKPGENLSEPGFFKKFIATILYILVFVFVGAYYTVLFLPVAAIIVPTYIQFPEFKDTIMYTTVTPHTLQAGSSLISEVYTYNGISFKAPWNLSQKTEKAPMIALAFTPPIGDRTIFVEPQSTVITDAVQRYKKPDVASSIRLIPGMEKVSLNSTYEVVKALMTINLKQFSMKINPQQAINITAFAAAKMAFTSGPADSSTIYNFETPVVRGFEIFNSSKYPKMHYIYFFDTKDQPHSMMIVGDNLPQNEVDAIISSITIVDK